MRRTLQTLLLIAGTVVPAIAASGSAFAVDAPPLPTTSTTTTTAPGETATDDVGTTTTTSTTQPGDTASEDASTEDEESSNGLLDEGGLSISVPEVVELSPGTPLGAGGLSASLGAVSVTDERGGLVAGWTASVTATDFATGGGTPAETIPKANVAYWSGPPSATEGAGPFMPGQLTSADAEPLAGPVLAFSSLGPSGSSSATWMPTVVVTFPPNATVGQYVGTITHSVA